MYYPVSTFAQASPEVTSATFGSLVARNIGPAIMTMAREEQLEGQPLQEKDFNIKMAIVMYLRILFLRSKHTILHLLMNWQSSSEMEFIECMKCRKIATITLL